MISPATIAVYAIAAVALSGHADRSCTDAGCHESMMKEPVVHPAIVDGCEICHEGDENSHPLKDGAEFKLTSPVPDLCQTCHQMTADSNVHAPFGSGDCTSCHSPHSSKTARLLLAASVGELCRGCHDLEDGNSHRHKPVRDGNCTGCHLPHQSAFPNLLRTTTAELCVGCHPRQAGEERAKSVHKPFAEDCRQCHSGHGSSVKAQLLASVPELCLRCHESTRLEITAKSTVHSVVKSNRACLRCHAAHSSDNARLLKIAEPKLCFQCHGGAMRISDSLRVNIEERLRTGNTIHAPVQDGCSSCHRPHASDVRYLLSNTFPSGNYTKPDEAAFALCLDCHGGEMLDSANSDGTQFRNGGQNLHAAHVMKQKALSCADCHEVHGAASPSLIAGTVRFGSWDMPLNFSSTNNGGSCRPACHAEKSYSR